MHPWPSNYTYRTIADYVLLILVTVTLSAFNVFKTTVTTVAFFVFLC
jgi:hypothetical protein